MNAPHIRSLVAALAVVAPAVFAGPASATLVVAAEGRLRYLCAEGETSEVGRVDVRQRISAEDFRGTGLLVSFDSPHRDAARPVRLRAVAEREEPEGGSRRIGLVRAKTDAAGVAEAVAPLRRPVASGDTVAWDVRLRRFEPLADNDCLALFVAVVGSGLGSDQGGD